MLSSNKYSFICNEIEDNFGFFKELLKPATTYTTYVVTTYYNLLQPLLSIITLPTITMHPLPSTKYLWGVIDHFLRPTIYHHLLLTYLPTYLTPITYYPLISITHLLPTLPTLTYLLLKIPRSCLRTVRYLLSTTPF